MARMMPPYTNLMQLIHMDCNTWESEMDQDTQQLVIDVMDGNPGALMIIQRLMYFSTWCLLLHHLKMQGLIGSELWRVVQDDYNQDWRRFAQTQLSQMGLMAPPLSHVAAAPDLPRWNCIKPANPLLTT